MRLVDLVQQLNDFGLSATLIGDGQVEVSHVASLTESGEGAISFFSDPKRLAQLQVTQASAVLLKQEFTEHLATNLIVVENPYYAYAFVAQQLHPRSFTPQIASSAIIGQNCQIAPSAFIGHHVVIGNDVIIGEHCYIGAGCVIEQGVSMGEQTYLYPNVTLMAQTQMGDAVTIESGTVIGGQGFGNANHRGEWLHIPQMGKVVIGNRVWIGNNCAIDRGALEDTVIADNCLIDNLVHIAHNVVIGYGSAIAGQVGFAGSTQLGQYCTLGGQAGVAGHLTLADNSHYFAKAGVTHSIKEPGVYSGFPAVPVKEWQKSTVKIKGIDKLTQRIKQLEQELSQIKNSLEPSQS